MREPPWSWQDSGTWSSTRKIQPQEGIVWALKDQFSPAGLVPVLALVDFGLHASPKVGQISCAPEQHGSYMFWSEKFETPLTKHNVGVGATSLSLGYLWGQGNLDGTPALFILGKEA